MWSVTRNTMRSPASRNFISLHPWSFVAYLFFRGVGTAGVGTYGMRLRGSLVFGNKGEPVGFHPVVDSAGQALQSQNLARIDRQSY